MYDRHRPEKKEKHSPFKFKIKQLPRRGEGAGENGGVSCLYQFASGYGVVINHQSISYLRFSSFTKQKGSVCSFPSIGLTAKWTGRMVRGEI
jgi:hypothetical protein